MRALLIGDIHLSDTPPSSRTDTYTQDILDKFEFAIQVGNEAEVDCCILLGDVFDKKIPHRTSHKLIQDTMDILEKAVAPVFIVVGNHDLCVSEDTEALTDQGWRHVYELDGTECFATLNRSTQELEFQRPTSITRERYVGTGYHFQSKSVDILTTPNHRWWGTWTTAPNKNALHVKTSADLAVGSTGWRLPTVRTWQGESPTEVQVGHHTLSADVAARLFGWFVAEGTVERSSSGGTGSRFTISQSREVNPEHYQEITDLLDDAGLVHTDHNKMIRVNDRSVAEFLATHFGFAGSKDMRLPRWLMGWSEELLKSFLFAYFRGDGTINGSKEQRMEADYTVSTVTATTANELLADDLSEVGVRLGYKVYKSPIREFPYGEEYIGHALRLGFSINKVNTQLPRPTEIAIDGVVWCPSVPNEVWLARRNGKMVWTGNTHDRLDSLPRQPLGTILRMPNVRQLVGLNTEFNIVGIPYLHDPDDWNYYLEEYDENTLLCFHASIFPESEMPPYDAISAEDLADMLPQAKNIAYGHIHTPPKKGPYYKAGDAYFCNRGAISRGSLHGENLTRTLGVTIFDSEAEGCPFTEVLLPFKPAEEVFKLERKQMVDESRERVTDFLESVGNVEHGFLTKEGIKAHVLQTLGVSNHPLLDDIFEEAE